MVIYGEYLFFENFLAGILILHASGRLLGLFPGKKRLFLGGVLCGLFSFTLFLDGLTNGASLLMKLAFSVLLMILVFYSFGGLWRRLRTSKFWKALARAVFIFFGVTFAMGGVTFGLMYLMDIPGITYGGGIYIGNVAYWHVYLGLFLAYAGFSALCSFLKGKLQKERTSVEIEVSMGGRTETLKGMVDTGNFLSDPVSGKPVFLVEERVLERFPKGDWPGRYRYIPYRSVGQEDGVLTGLRPDRVILEGEEGRRRLDVILAVYKGAFPKGRGGEEYQLLLHPSALGAGVLEER